MGSWYSLSFGNYHVESGKSYIEPIFTTFFRESDKRYTEELSEDGTLSRLHQYQCSVATACRRLDIMGFTVNGAANRFNIGIQNESSVYSGHAPTDYTFARWLNIIKEVMGNNISMGSLHYIREELPQLGDSVRWILEAHEYFDAYYGFPGGSDPRYVLRAMLHLCDPDDLVVLDYTDLVNGGYYAEDARICELALMSIRHDVEIADYIIILTEGSTDREFIHDSMELLYPDVADYYRFLDFDSTKSPGGAPSLVATMKALAGAGIANRVLAIFDNDTGGREAMRGLGAITLPSNFRALTLPALEFAESYPTIGPQGRHDMDINGLAGGIELYLGVDVLKNSQGELTPVHWRGYSTALKAYQGELLYKSELQRRYREKVRRCSQDRSLIGLHDFSSMRLVFEMIFRAFSNDSASLSDP